MKVKSRLAACVQDERLTFTFIPPSRSVFAPRRYAYDWVGARFLNKTSCDDPVNQISEHDIHLHAAQYAVSSPRVYVTRKSYTTLSYVYYGLDCGPRLAVTRHMSYDQCHRFYADFIRVLHWDILIHISAASVNIII